MNTLRITSGKYRGRVISTPGGKTHPMGERERLALFNMIASHLPEAIVLDAFAGSGALGIEALSRGARKVVFVAKNSEACRIIRKNLATLGENSEVDQLDISNYTSDTRFDVILADPPYDSFNPAVVQKLVKLLSGEGILVLSHPGEAPEIAGLKCEKSRTYAGATISIYVKI